MTIALAAQNPAAAPPPQARGQQQPPKNLKVLPKAWTGQQVRALMQTFAESLGVQCTHCHAADPTAPRRPKGVRRRSTTASTRRKKKRSRAR